jgi:hypothetical protein
MKDNIKKNVMLSDGFKKSSMRSSGGLSWLQQWYMSWIFHGNKSQ